MEGEENAADASAKQEKNDHQAGSRNSSKYNLRQLNSVKYFLTTMPSQVTTSDEPKSSEASYWVDAIFEEFNTIKGNSTYVDDYDIPSNEEVIPTGITLRLKRDQ